MEDETKKEITNIYNEMKQNFGYWLSPSEQQNFWATFGLELYKKYLLEEPKEEWTIKSEE